MSGVAVVTGGIAGIGRAVSLALGDRGFDVAVLDPGPDDEHVVSSLTSSGRKALHLPIDVSHEADVEAAAATISAELGDPVVLVNNAGVFPRFAALEGSYSEWMDVVRINLGGAFLCSRTFAPGMLRGGQGAIVNLSSGRALAGAPRGSHYAASKGGIIALTRSLALEWAPTIRVNTVIPGLTDTSQPRVDMSEDDLQEAARAIPLGRIGQPRDAAELVCFLVSSSADYITGQSYAVNGGAILQ
ncbi:MAG: 3-oxoacyl-[acyl-carrier protein] reductase [Nocardioides sp.]|jgi:NAD(P)-dependent dehydrogenase (short-subunit alcohol dehydrogenase family)|uniref:SDR family NAD(P)-dependent oxidoreductase n=1 Tax=Nocardioides sp. TaxID=35761 RepID=UPI002603386F|nr:SDR family NAD(P)-dependent oxidoreductase [Nocardioides sp.]MCW2835032.1 3-oxoacyl-[acyl-carrier protein] reductase [Nocardioides sp.]